MRILILTNYDLGLYKFRRELLETLVREHTVSVCVPEGKYTARIGELGCFVLPCALMDRRGMNPVKDLRLYRFYRNLIREQKPDAVLTYTIKPNVYGGLAAAGAGVPYFANITGLGTSIENGGLLACVSTRLYRSGLRKAACVFFQNEGNLRYFKERGQARQGEGGAVGGGRSTARGESVCVVGCGWLVRRELLAGAGTSAVRR